MAVNLVLIVVGVFQGEHQVEELDEHRDQDLLGDQILHTVHQAVIDLDILLA